MTQAEYCRILFVDCGFSPSQQRDFLGLRYNRKYLDELTVGELSELIDDLKERKPVPAKRDEELDEQEEMTAKERLNERRNRR